jgi:hypothetical protein
VCELESRYSSVTCSCDYGNEISGSIKGGKFPDWEEELCRMQLNTCERADKLTAVCATVEIARLCPEE